jgi:hypothetical protein
MEEVPLGERAFQKDGESTPSYLKSHARFGIFPAQRSGRERAALASQGENMLRFGAILLFAGVTMASAASVAMAIEAPVPLAAPSTSFELGATACPAASTAPSADIGTPAPIFKSCVTCKVVNITGPVQTASDSNCTAATNDLHTALFNAATADCQHRGWDFICSGSLVVHITSACSVSGSLTSVSGNATYGCAFISC